MLLFHASLNSSSNAPQDAALGIQSDRPRINEEDVQMTNFLG